MSHRRRRLGSREPVEPPPVSQRSDYESDEWYTPQEYIDAAKAVMGGIDLDPASSELAQTVVKADVYLTRFDNGLGQARWLHQRIWLNPPYSNPGPWIEKLVREHQAGTVLHGGDCAGEQRHGDELVSDAAGTLSGSAYLPGASPSGAMTTPTWAPGRAGVVLPGTQCRQVPGGLQPVRADPAEDWVMYKFAAQLAQGENRGAD